MTFAQSWTAEILARPPLIAPARHYIFPQAVAGEEDALARGALLLNVRPATGGNFLATCALGFTSPALPSGIFPCPHPDHLCAVAGGYAYLIDTLHPERSLQVELRPVVEVRPLEDANLLLFVGFHTLLAWGRDGLAWQTARLSWEGLRLATITADQIVGFGWEMQTDRELEFRVDLHTGAHHGGGYLVQPKDH